MASWKLIQKAKVLLEKERGTTYKPWGGKISICLLYPNSYHVGMSNLGFQTLYRSFNSEEDVVCERAFLPDPEDIEEYRKTSTPLFSLESHKPLTDFDLLAFSISFENDYLNVLSLLDLARLPKESSKRTTGFPLVVGGGVATFLNPEPVSPFFDLFILGEAEEVLGEFLDVLRHHPGDWKRGKDSFLKKVAEVEGVYVPKFYHVTYREDGKIEAMLPEPGFPRKIKRRWVQEIDRFSTCSSLFTPDTEFKGMALVEMNRGCPRGCRFCAAFTAYHPFRNRSLPALESLSTKALLDESRIGLTGTAVSDHPHLLSLCQSIVSREGEISLSSLRIDAISPLLTDCLKAGEDRSVAIAPEAGSERLRKMLRKGYSEEEILKAVDTLVDSGVSQIKCYFMIGLPSETDEDVKAILALAKRMRHQMLRHRKEQKERGRVILSVNAFIPKPATPFQWASLDRVGELKRKIKILQRGLAGEKGMKMIHDLPKWSYIQCLLSMGDRRVGKILMEVNRHGGDWSRALRETPVNPDFYVHRKKELDEIFAWDFIDHGIPKEKLKEEYLEAMEETGAKISKVQ